RQSLLDRRVGRTVLRGAPARHADPSIGSEDPSHLAKRPEPIGEELEALLTEDEIEHARLERKGHHTRLPPYHGRMGHHPSRDRQHGRVDVEADHGPLRTYTLGRQAGDGTGPAGDV